MIDHSDKVILYEEEGNGYVGISYEPYLKKYVLHIECKEWSLSTYKRYKRIGEVIKKKLKERGITEVYGLSDTPKEVKFNIMFGGEFTGKLAETEDGEYKYLVKGEL